MSERYRPPTVEGLRSNFSPEKFNAIFGSEEMQYLRHGEIMRMLIPAMRREGLETILLGVYEGDAEEALDTLTVTHIDGKTRAVDSEGRSVSIFQPSIQSSRRRTRESDGEKVYTLQEWLREKELQTHQVTFCPFTITEETPDTDGEDSVVQDTKEELPAAVETRETAQKPLAQQEVPSADLRSARAPKPPRKPVRRKPIKGEVRARQTAEASRQFESIVEVVRTAIDDMAPRDQSDLVAATSLIPLGVFLSRNPSFQSVLIERLNTNADYRDLAFLLRLFRSDHMWETYIAPGMRQSAQRRALTDQSRANGLTTLRNLAKKSFPQSTTINPDTSDFALLETKATGRGLEMYLQLLFPDVDPIAFLRSLKQRRGERWLDVGSGANFTLPDSMMNILAKYDITLVGIDPAYREYTYGASVRGAELSAAMEQHELYPDSIQRIRLPDHSFTLVMSSLVFDKLNEENEGYEQAVRQVARVLTPGGEARIHFVSEAQWQRYRSCFEKYFSVSTKMPVIDVHSPSRGKELVYFLRLTRKELPESEEKTLTRECEAWVRAHPA